MSFKNVTVAGSGVLGSQIAFQTAFKGFNVVVYDINDEALEKAKERIQALLPYYQADLGTTKEAFEEGLTRLTYTADLEKAVAEADLVIEAIPEVVSIKTEFYTTIGKFAPKETIFVTNSSTMLPSQFAEVTGRPEKFLALHFANSIWKNNTAEIMKHANTNEVVFQSIIDFAKEIDMVPLPIYKEQPGYILNSLLVPFLDAAEVLLLRGIAEPEIIDKTWMIGTGSPLGPFAILDIVGINTAQNIVAAKAQATGNEEMIALADLLKTNYIDKGKLGRATGEGFYKYPNPTFAQPDFLK